MPQKTGGAFWEADGGVLVTGRFDWHPIEPRLIEIRLCLDFLGQIFTKTKRFSKCYFQKISPLPDNLSTMNGKN